MSNQNLSQDNIAAQNNPRLCALEQTLLLHQVCSLRHNFVIARRQAIKTC